MIRTLPALNACANAFSAVLLVCGYIAVRSERIKAHRALMLGALSASLFFLVSYLAYHAMAGAVRFQGRGPIRPFYFAILVSHTSLAAINVPLILRAAYLAWRGRFEDHRRLARWVWPSWMYVSVTGVAVYWMLYRL